MLEAEKEARARDQVAARSAVATEKAEQERLQGVIDDLEGRSGNAAKRLRSAELEGGNLRALATAACDKLEAMEKVADAMKEDLQRSNAYLAERDDAIMSLERKLSESLDQKKEVESLRVIVMELQQVLREALKAGSWKQCRQVLYHESLR